MDCERNEQNCDFYTFLKLNFVGCIAEDDKQAAIYIINRQQKVHFLDDTRVMLFITDWLFAVFWLTWDIDRFDSKAIINWRRTK